VEDLKPGAADTQVGVNPTVKYCTIGGDWNPFLRDRILSASKT
jgi:hypothetical protein